MTKWMTLLLALAASASMSAASEPSAAFEDNWSQWRGPLANGTAPNADPPIEWDAKTNIRWKAPLEGRGSSSPIIWNDRVFVTTAIKTEKTIDPSKQNKADRRFQKKTQAPTNFYQWVVYCFDRNDGKLRWRNVAAEAVPHEGHHESHSYAAGSPTTDGERLYVSFGSQGTFCYNLDGKLLWKRELGLLNTRLGWGEAVTPVVHGDSLLLNWDQEDNSKLYCLNAADGKTKWVADRDEKTSWNTPLVVDHDGQIQVVMNGTNKIRGYDLKTGKVIWECGGMTVNAIPTPVTDGNVLYCMSGYRGAAAVAVRLGETGDVSDSPAVLWKAQKGTPYVPSPLLVGGRLYFTQGNNAMLTILDAKTGKPILDRARLPEQRAFYASPIAAAGRIYLVDRDGTTLVIKQADTLEVLATNRLDDPIDASLAAVGKNLFLRGEKYLYCIGAE